MSKSKEAIKQDAEKVAAAFGYNVDSMNLNVINVKDAYCIGFQNGANEQSREVAIGFFKWYGIKMMGFIEYMQQAKPLVVSEEIEKKLEEFEGKPIEALFDLYIIQSKTSK